jgi:hypothetical protein
MNVLDSEPCDKINENWFWIKHFNHVKSFIKNPLKDNLERKDFKNMLKTIELELTKKINKISFSESNFTEEQLLNEFSSLNKLAWKKTEELIEEK